MTRHLRKPGDVTTRLMLEKNNNKTPFADTWIGKLIILAAALLLLIVVFDKIIMPYYTNQGETIRMPDFINKDTLAIKTLIAEKQLIAVNEDSQYSDIFARGTVITHRPLPNAVIKENRRVYITYSKGKRPLFMPNLVGKGPRDSEIEIKQLGLKLGNTIYRYSSYYPSGVVISQSIPPNDPISKNLVVDITISKGTSPDKLLVPDVLNQSLDLARKKLGSIGLPVDTIFYEERSDVLPNIVLQQSMTAGTLIEAGDKITLTVSKNE
jgi:beta-lactam-binding protein with PASTA domain